MPSAPEVWIVEVATTATPASARLEYEVHNSGEGPIWLNDDRWLVWFRDGHRVELSFARARLRKGVEVFGYFPPAVERIEPGRRLHRTVELRWPQPLSGLWNEERIADLPPGRYLVSVRVGYATGPEPETPELGEGVEESVLRWQQEAVSPPMPMDVPAHATAEAGQ